MIKGKIKSGTVGESVVGQLLRGNFIQIHKDKRTPRLKVISWELKLNYVGETISNQKEEKFQKAADRVELSLKSWIKMSQERDLALREMAASCDRLYQEESPQ